VIAHAVRKVGGEDEDLAVGQGRGDGLDDVVDLASRMSGGNAAQADEAEQVVRRRQLVEQRSAWCAELPQTSSGDLTPSSWGSFTA
jgi:hypothetical protein